MKQLKLSFFRKVLVCAVLILAYMLPSCQKSPAEPAVIRVSGVSLSTDALTLIEGESQVLKATVSPYNADNKRVIWSSSDISIADVSSLGTVQAIKEGKAKIKVITDDGAKTAECQVTVKAKVVKVESVNLNKNDLTMTEGDSGTLTATVYPSDATNKNVTWTSSDPSVATVNNGTVKAVKAGSTTIRVTTADGSKTAECRIVVKAKTVSVTSVTLNKSALTMTEGDSETLTATVYPSNATNKNVTWTSSNPSVASVNNGTVKAVKAGTTTIKVITADGNKTAECQVTVKAKTVSVTSVTLNRSSLTMTEGDSGVLTATVYPSNATNKNVTWTSSDPSVASVNNGTVKAVKAGTTTIKVTTADGSKTAECRVAVNARTVSVTSVMLNKTALSITEGDSEVLTATVYPSNATNKNVTWTSSNPSVASVNNGTVKAVKAGTTTIKVITADGSKIAECQVTVKAKTVSVTSVVLNRSSLTMTEGDSEILIAGIYPSNATNKNVTWTSSDASIVNVNNGIVQALKPGRATVKVTSEDGGKTAECQITVKRKDINGGHEGVVEKEW